MSPAMATAPRVDGPKFSDLKPGDLLGEFAIVLGTPTPEVRSGGYLGLNPGTSQPGILCFRQSGDLGQFIPLTEEHWGRGAASDYRPGEQDPDTVKKLLALAQRTLREKTDVFFGDLKIDRKVLNDTVDQLSAELTN